MGERLIKPYEISVWEDKLIQYGENDYRFEENKLAVIGSDTMTGLNRVYDPVFNKKTNGEKTLTFSLKYKYFDPYSGNDGVVNPFAALLINECKVKLHYDDQWYEFIVKDHTESSDELTWTYTCTDAFVLELSKQGYNLTFDSELQNNQGTAAELAEKVLENTEWQLKEASPGKQLIAEPIYKAKLVGNADIINVSETEDVIPAPITDIYVFYSYVKNQDGKFVQFIIRDENRKYIIDDKNVITDTNYRIVTDLTYDADTQAFKDINGITVIQLENQINNEAVNPIETRYQANRLAYGQLTTYDSVMQRTVDRFKVDDREVYKYTDYIYTTSDVVMNYITNGDNFNALEDGTLQGWNPYVDSTDKVKPLDLVTKPELSSEKELVDLNNFFQIEGFLKTRFNGARIDTTKESEESDDTIYVFNTIFNSGIENHESFIKNISKGDEFVFRWRAGQGDFDNLQPMQSLRMIVAKYDQDKPTWGYYYKHIKQEDIIIEFTGQVTEDNILNNYIEGGTLESVTVDGVTRQNYVIDTVVQTPSTKYIYKVGDEEYIWDNTVGDFIPKENNNYLPYYYLKATATKSVSAKELTSTDSHYGIFIYTIDDLLTEEVIVEQSFVEEEELEEEEQIIEEPLEEDEEEIEDEDDEEEEEPNYPQRIEETLESKKGTTITVEYIDSTDTTYSYNFTAGVGVTLEACTYDSSKDTIKILNGIGIKSYRITYYTVSPIYIQEIQFTRYIPNIKNNKEEPVLIGNIPTANSQPINYYYLKPEDGEAAEDVKTYASLNELEDDLGLMRDSIKPLYNENSEKNLTISASQSNCFNILQTIAETFECWVDLVVDHDEYGYITYTNDKPNKYVYLKEFIGKDNWAGFKYGINLESIERTINSEEIVTKLIVNQSQSDLVDEGYISIANAPSNTNGESYVLNFDYYYNQGLLDRNNTEADKLKFATEVADLNKQLQENETLRRNYEMSMLQLDAKRTDYNLLVESAQNMKNEALENFEKYTGKTYEEYRQEHNDIVEGRSKTEYYVSPNTKAVTNIFSISDLPKSDTEINVNIQDWNQTVQFISGKIKTISIEEPEETVVINETVEIDNSYDISFSSVIQEQETIDIPIGSEVTITIEEYLSDLESEDTIISIVIGTDSIGENDILSYEYNSSTNIISITAIEKIIIKSYTYKTIRIITYNGFKEFRFMSCPLGSQEVIFTYIPSLENLLTEEETIFDILGELYTSSATIHNYSGILTNVELEYWDIRKKLRGSENYTVKAWFGIDANEQKHIYISLNDYLSNVQCYVGDNPEPYKSSLSLKYFDIPVNNNVTDIRFVAPQGYYFKDNNGQPTEKTITVKETKTTLSIICNETVDGVEDIIKELQEKKDELTVNFNNKYSRFIQEGTWSSTDYIDAEHYYLDALQVSNTSAQPTVSYTINVVEVSQLEGLELYRFDTGDKTYVEDTEFFGWSNVGDVLTPAREEVIVSEVEWHLEEPENNVITVQNYKTRFEDLFQRINAAVQTVQYNEATYAKISSLLDADGTINQSVLLESLNRISGQKFNLTSDGSVLINGDQILVQNLNNLANYVIINSEGIQVSPDGGSTWQTAINGEGINAGLVKAGSLNTDQVIIGNNKYPSFRWDKAGISAYKSTTQTLEEDGQAIDVYDLQTYVRYDQYGLYGIKEGGTFKAQSLQDVLDKAHFAVTWDGFFIKNSYEDGGRVSITSDNDFQVIDGSNIERIKIGSLGVENGERIYGINISNKDGNSVFVTNNDGDVTITGTINATGGNFSGIVNVGPENQDHIIIDGQDALIQSSNYQDGAGYGWMINKDGDAVFNNITARGAIKTAVFEYAEIQAVGGIFIFRPSSTIRTAVIDSNDIIFTVEKPHLFQVGDWCKVSNYLDENQTDDARVNNILLTNGLTQVYEVIEANGRVVKLEGAAAMVQGEHAVTDLASLEGGALIDMGNKVNGDGQVGTSNYGIGINSSDNTVNLPRRAITLFETVINENQNPKVSYKYRGILGTLPALQYSGQNAQVDQLYHDYLEGTQGIYTDNMYLGDNNQYIAFYTDNNSNKQLKIKANQIMFEVTDGQGQGTGQYKDVTEVAEGADGKDAIYVMIDSTAGMFFQHGQIDTYLVAHVYQGNEEITSQFSEFDWYRRLPNGDRDPSWSTEETSNLLRLTTADVDERAVFVCEITIA